MTSTWRSLIICCILLVVWVARPIGIHPRASLGTDFDADRAVARLSTILGDERPHPIDSAANDAVELRLLQQIERVGFTPQIDERFHCNDRWPGAAVCAKVRNISFWVDAPGEDAVLLLAHYDSVPAGPGAADDGIGMAVILELAYLLKDEKLTRPLLVLFTDGEEAGLVGAAAFAAHDPRARHIGAVINLEARGTTGVASMFQTSSPNGYDIAALASGGKVPVSNSLASDLYKILPNDTDLSLLLPLGVDAANYAIIGGGKRYHTPLDNLAHLDVRSVLHMGVSVLSAIHGFAEVEKNGEEGTRVYTDINQTFFFVVSQTMAGILLGLGLLASMIAYVRIGGAKPVISFFVPLFAVVAGTVLAVGLGIIISMLRPEADFATAYPQAFRTVYGAAALVGASLVVRGMKVQNGVRLATAAWVWISMLVLVGYFVIPGLSSLIIGALLFVILAVLASYVPKLKPVMPILLIVAALVFAIVILPIAGGIENGLFIQNAAPVSIFLAFLYVFLMPNGRSRSWLVPIGCGAVLSFATIATLVVPAYAPDAPRHLTIVHEDDGGVGSFLIFDNGPLPTDMTAVAKFETTPNTKGYWRAPAPSLDSSGEITVLSDTVISGERTIKFAIAAPQSDRHDFFVEDGEGVRSLIFNGVELDLKPPLRYFGCTGRTCRQIEVELVVDADAPLPKITWHVHQYGAGLAAATLVLARPVTAQPVHVGDKRTRIRVLSLSVENRDSE